MTPDQFAARRRALSARLGARLRRLFTGLGSWRDPDADQFVRDAVPLVHGTQRALGAFTAAFIAAHAAAALQRPVRPPRVPDTSMINLRAGVVPSVVYRRPFVALYTALSDGRPLAEAVHLGAVRLEQVAEADLQLTYAAASQAAMRDLPDARPTGWRRVLVGDENCALCVVASTNRYTIEDLNPIHPGCDCAVQPVFGQDRHADRDAARLEQVHAAVAELTAGTADRGARAPDYRHLVVSMIANHGELGPMLVQPGDRFTSPADL